jgi:hypothetical protein
MSVTYEWVIVDLQVALLHDSMVDVVVAVNWRYQGNDGTCVANVYGLTELDPADPNDYVPFDQLTSQQVIDWLILKLGQEAITGFQNQIVTELANHNYTVVTRTLI